MKQLRSVITISTMFAAAGCGGDAGGYQGLHARTVRAAVPAIEKSVGRSFKTPPQLAERSRDELKAFLERTFNEQMPVLELAGIEGSYKRFGLIPDTLDLRTFMMQLLNEQVAGYYDPKNDTLYVMKDLAPELVGLTVDHELVHALQDQHFPLDSLERIKPGNDRRTAAQAVAEGEAVWEQLVVMTGVANPANAMPGGWDGVRNMIRQNQSSMPILNNAPLILSEVLLFPYLSGAEHIRQFKTRVPGGWPFDSLPESTEQIMHADKYFGTRDHPTNVTLPPLQGGAKLVYQSDLGEFEMKVLLYQLTKDQASATLGASGWDGDQYALISVGGSDGLVWATVWDSPLDAAEFVDVLGAALPNRYRGMKLTSGQAEVRRYEGAGRTVELRPVTIDGRPVVLFTDIPAGVGLPLTDAARIILQ